MALAFADGSSNRVNHGSSSSLDNLTAGTLLCWVYPTSVANTLRFIVEKQNAAETGGWVIHKRVADGTSLRFARVNTAGGTKADAVSNTGVLVVNTWLCLAVTWDINNSANNSIYKGTLTALLADATNSRGGSGTDGDDSAETLYIGNDRNFAGGWPGRIAVVQIWNRVLTLAELQQQQFRPYKTDGSVLFTHLGIVGAGTQPDWSGNGNTGTVTGATVADHVPHGPLFGFDSGWQGAFTAAAAGRTTKNTRSDPLGIDIGMGWRMNAPTP